MYILLEIHRDDKIFLSRWFKEMIPVFHCVINICKKKDVVYIYQDKEISNRKIIFKIERL